MPRADVSPDDLKDGIPLDYCRTCWKEEYGDADHPPYDSGVYECHNCGDKLTNKDSYA